MNPEQGRIEISKLTTKNYDLSDYQFVPLIYTFEVKFDGRGRTQLVPNGDATIGSPEAEVWSGVVSTDTVCTALFLGMLNDLKILAADISSTYLFGFYKGKDV